MMKREQEEEPRLYPPVSLGCGLLFGARLQADEIGAFADFVCADERRMLSLFR